MPREQFLREQLAGLFSEKRSGLMRRRGDGLPVHSSGQSHGTPTGGLKPTRWIQRDGRRIRVCTGVGPFTGRVHVFHLPNHSLALEFAVELLKTDTDGLPAALDPEWWAAAEAEYD